MQKLFYVMAFLLLAAGMASAQPVDLERTLPECVGRSDEEVQAVLGRPDNVWAGQTFMTFRYTRWPTWSVTLFFKPYGGRWVVDDYSLYKTSGIPRHGLPGRP